MQIPRIGQEVIVSFLEGDPDRPIITGRVYNAEQTVPYELPANATQSGTKSRSSKGGTPANFNEIRMEDKKGAEQLSRLLSYDLTEGSGGRDPTDPAKVRAVVTVDGGAASRWVVVIERKLDGEWRVAGVGQTAESGRAEIALEVTAGGTT